MNKNLFRSVNELELSVRAANCLKNANIKTIADLVQKTEGEMLRTKNFGKKSLNEIKEILTEMGLGLGVKLDAVQPISGVRRASNERRGNPCVIEKKADNSAERQNIDGRCSEIS